MVGRGKGRGARARGVVRFIVWFGIGLAENESGRVRRIIRQPSQGGGGEGRGGVAEAASSKQQAAASRSCHCRT